MEEDIKNSFNRIETIMNNEVCEFNKTIIEGNLNVIKRYIENLIKRNKELEEERDSLMWQRNNIDIHKIEALEQEKEYLNMEKDLLASQLKAEKIYGNKVTIDLKNGNLPDILVKDYIPKSALQELLDIYEIGVVHYRIKKMLGDD